MHAESRDSMYIDTARLARLLELPAHNDAHQERVVESLRGWLSRHDRWLLVLDNVSDLDTVEPLLVPHKGADHDTVEPLLSGDGRGHGRVTARETGGKVLAERVPVEPLDEDASATLLLRRARRSEPGQQRAAR